MKRAIIGLACLAFSATACTPQEVAFWHAFHQDQPAEAEALLNDLGLLDEAPAAAVRVPGLEIVDVGIGIPYRADATCAGTLRISNTGSEPFTYAAVYGPTMTPLVSMLEETLDYPVLEPGDSATADISEALPGIGDSPIHVFLDRGRAFDVVGSC